MATLNLTRYIANEETEKNEFMKTCNEEGIYGKMKAWMNYCKIRVNISDIKSVKQYNEYSSVSTIDGERYKVNEERGYIKEQIEKYNQRKENSPKPRINEPETPQIAPEIVIKEVVVHATDEELQEAKKAALRDIYLRMPTEKEYTEAAKAIAAGKPKQQEMFIAGVRYCCEMFATPRTQSYIDSTLNEENDTELPEAENRQG